MIENVLYIVGFIVMACVTAFAVGTAYILYKADRLLSQLEENYQRHSKRVMKEHEIK